MPLPYKLNGLSTREAIIDGLHRCVDGMDMSDKALFESSCTKDAIFDLAGTELSGIEEIHKGCFDIIASLDTTHFVTNIRVDIHEGDKTASLSAHALSHHYRPGEGVKNGSETFGGGALYDFEFVKDESDGLWKWKFWKIKLVWRQGVERL